MGSSPPFKVRCDECYSTMAPEAVLEVFIDHPKPGYDRVEVAQCPECGEVNCLTRLCDEAGCTGEATCGWPTNDGGYRTTCGIHMRSNETAHAKR